MRLIETSNPLMGVTYTVWERSLRIWRGTDIAKAELELDQAARKLEVAN